uniref:Uncharacterized protein n=1 Tax=Chromera velia CCMP2878 TaxID=1169474 RepID=A0A0G4HSK3_9ALVE|eukprot:Cvel_8312.t1-p1 / transcript=Cvel_8312.t1 / gene=Cvel_8312 / organism=Chromera_velia_CCMP2878 / gene_product=hypothetical protein / transcript_product=hypothetical protein / location=Cvel_scaffold456:49457-63188(-) / protein_length=1694 / sequence_SO=supercontig / SO=protein_coding / is_pseudo=false
MRKQTTKGPAFTGAYTATAAAQQRRASQIEETDEAIINSLADYHSHVRQVLLARKREEDRMLKEELEELAAINKEAEELREVMEGHKDTPNQAIDADTLLEILAEKERLRLEKENGPKPANRKQIVEAAQEAKARRLSAQMEEKHRRASVVLDKVKSRRQSYLETRAAAFDAYRDAIRQSVCEPMETANVEANAAELRREYRARMQKFLKSRNLKARRKARAIGDSILKRVEKAKAMRSSNDREIMKDLEYKIGRKDKRREFLEHDRKSRLTHLVVSRYAEGMKALRKQRLRKARFAAIRKLMASTLRRGAPARSVFVSKKQRLTRAAQQGELNFQRSLAVLSELGFADEFPDPAKVAEAEAAAAAAAGYARKRDPNVLPTLDQQDRQRLEGGGRGVGGASRRQKRRGRQGRRRGAAGGGTETGGDSSRRRGAHDQPLMRLEVKALGVMAEAAPYLRPAIQMAGQPPVQKSVWDIKVPTPRLSVVNTLTKHHRKRMAFLQRQKRITAMNDAVLRAQKEAAHRILDQQKHAGPGWRRAGPEVHLGTDLHLSQRRASTVQKIENRRASQNYDEIERKEKGIEQRWKEAAARREEGLLLRRTRASRQAIWARKAAKKRQYLKEKRSEKDDVQLKRKAEIVAESAGRLGEQQRALKVVMQKRAKKALIRKSEATRRRLELEDLAVRKLAAKITRKGEMARNRRDGVVRVKLMRLQDEAVARHRRSERCLAVRSISPLDIAARLMPDPESFLIAVRPNAKRAQPLPLPQPYATLHSLHPDTPVRKLAAKITRKGEMARNRRDGVVRVKLMRLQDEAVARHRRSERCLAVRSISPLDIAARLMPDPESFLIAVRPNAKRAQPLPLPQPYATLHSLHPDTRAGFLKRRVSVLRRRILDSLMAGGSGDDQKIARAHSIATKNRLFDPDEEEEPEAADNEAEAQQQLTPKTPRAALAFSPLRSNVRTSLSPERTRQQQNQAARGRGKGDTSSERESRSAFPNERSGTDVKSLRASRSFATALDQLDASSSSEESKPSMAASFVTSGRQSRMTSRAMSRASHGDLSTPDENGTGEKTLVSGEEDLDPPPSQTVTSSPIPEKPSPLGSSPLQPTVSPSLSGTGPPDSQQAPSPVLQSTTGGVLKDPGLRVNLDAGGAASNQVTPMAPKSVQMSPTAIEVGRRNSMTQTNPPDSKLSSSKAGGFFRRRSHRSETTEPDGDTVAGEREGGAGAGGDAAVLATRAYWGVYEGDADISSGFSLTSTCRRSKFAGFLRTTQDPHGTTQGSRLVPMHQQSLRSHMSLPSLTEEPQNNLNRSNSQHMQTTKLVPSSRKSRRPTVSLKERLGAAAPFEDPDSHALAQKTTVRKELLQSYATFFQEEIDKEDSKPASLLNEEIDAQPVPPQADTKAAGFRGDLTAMRRDRIQKTFDSVVQRYIATEFGTPHRKLPVVRPEDLGLPSMDVREEMQRLAARRELSDAEIFGADEIDDPSVFAWRRPRKELSTDGGGGLVDHDQAQEPHGVCSGLPSIQVGVTSLQKLKGALQSESKSMGSQHIFYLQAPNRLVTWHTDFKGAECVDNTVMNKFCKIGTGCYIESGCGFDTGNERRLEARYTPLGFTYANPIWGGLSTSVRINKASSTQKKEALLSSSSPVGFRFCQLDPERVEDQKRTRLIFANEMGDFDQKMCFQIVKVQCDDGRVCKGSIGIKV